MLHIILWLIYDPIHLAIDADHCTTASQKSCKLSTAILVTIDGNQV